MYGCVDPGDTPPEPLDLVVSRIRAALQYVDPERLLIAPDCGLMMAGPELARQKSALLAQAAAQVRRTT
jgi:5-methyltetrahydropteroyltriglutamate--homocysteine methyltransferase